MVIFYAGCLELDRYIETKNAEGVQKVNANAFYNVFNKLIML